MPTADLLYSSPYDALMTPDTKGGWVDVQTIGSTKKRSPGVPSRGRGLGPLAESGGASPAQGQVRLQERARTAVGDRAYSDMDRSPQVSDDTFVPKIPEGYNRIRIMRHATVEDPAVGAAQPDPSKAGPGAKPAK